MKPVEVAYDLTAEDAFAFLEDAARRSPTVRQRSVSIHVGLVILGLVTGAVIWIGTPQARPEQFVVFAIAIAITYAILCLVDPLRVVKRRALRKLIEREEVRKQLGPQKVVVGSDGISQANPVGASHIAWHGIQEIHETPDYAFFHLGELKAVIVPARAFSDRVAFDRFVEAARAYRDQAVPLRAELA
jgi:YcxB-like protein